MRASKARYGEEASRTRPQGEMVPVYDTEETHQIDIINAEQTQVQSDTVANLEAMSTQHTGPIDQLYR